MKNLLISLLISTSVITNAVGADVTPRIFILGYPVDVILDDNHTLAVENVEKVVGEDIYIDLNNDGIPEVKLEGYKSYEPWVYVSFVVKGESIGFIHAKVYKKS